MQQGRRSTNMKASLEALQYAQTADVGILGIPNLSLASTDVRDAASNATTLASATTKKQKKYLASVSLKRTIIL